MTSKSAAASSGQSLWAKTPKANAELFALTYGSLVTEVVRDADGDADAINQQLDKIGHNIGIRSIDEFLAKSNAPHCQSFADTANVLGKTAFKMFLGINVDVQVQSPTTFTLILQENPLCLFVELPEQYKDTLQYSILYCGVIRGALEMLNFKVECVLSKNTLKGDDVDEIKVELKQVLQDGAGDDYKEE